MTQKSAYYLPMIGSPGCLPDHLGEPIECATRGELVAMIDSELHQAGFPIRSRRQINLVQLWRWIQRNGSNERASFTITNRNLIVEFRGLPKSDF